MIKILDKIQINRPPNIREEVHKLLRQKILKGEIPPGTKLVEAKLAEEIRTSRTPVREALHKLEMEKLILSLPRVGYVVREINESEVEEMFEIRVALETLAAKWAASRMSAKDIQRLHKNIQRSEKAVQKNDIEAIMELDTEFHDIICKASNSQRIEEISQALRDHLLRFRIMGLSKKGVAGRSNEGHRMIYQAIKEGDRGKIEEAVRFHLSQTCTDLKRVLKDISSQIE